MKVLLIYNPNAGNHTFKNNLDSIMEKFQAQGYLVSPFRLGQGIDLNELFQKIDPAEYKKLLIAGGDGTINQVLNAMLHNGITLPIGIYPAGTANDFAQNFNLPPMVDEITDIYTRENYSYADIGMINNRYFINVASLGCLVDVSQKTDTKLKNSFGIFSYYLKGIEEFQRLKPVRIRIESDQLIFDEEAYFMLIMNGKSAGGFKKIAPLSVYNDGLLDIYIFKKCPLIDLMALVGKALKGEHDTSPHVIYFQTSKLTVMCDENIGTDLDGEKGIGFPLNVQVLPSHLKINTKFNNEDGFSSTREFSFADVKFAAEQISNGVLSEMARPFREFRIDRNVIADMVKIVSDLPRHNALNYINKGSLNNEYFKIAEESLNDGYLYVVLSSTGSAAGELIRKVTKKEYSHASLSFDQELRTIISYNGGENIYEPGLNQEMLEFFNQKEDANIIIYKIKATREEKFQALEEVKKINSLGSSYNLLGLLVPYSHRENIMFCSQFVYSILKAVGLHYFDKKPEDVKPTDFVELDYKRNLQFHSQIFFKDYFE
ncbi:YegS/Rv2252/BmrU family lipid kinase [Sinanaerobacter chloroacetimidivorans]|uniref:YegS/Rv2252/BmrU family lipid kinase n=1 Tax=Sinanaerobacter chloroacetimidivorans TaxID=2818044 RepID=A0A8J7VZW7_9FIRM|nr:YegS/Rv2252/BmrU family lipid kinase [Sinanaerobacter chloroacetimidivorans]MBR0596673.1 YegS/Rv2252/BmrU family lipid kinase [Sinanaerobacter chloroacetimidivorans]